MRKEISKTSSGIIIEHKTIVNNLLDSLHEVGFYELSLDPINNLRIIIESLSATLWAFLLTVTKVSRYVPYDLLVK